MGRKLIYVYIFSKKNDRCDIGKSDIKYLKREPNFQIVENFTISVYWLHTY